MGYSADTFSAGEQPTTSKFNKLWSNDASFNDGTGILDGAITPKHLNSSAPSTSNAWQTWIPVWTNFTTGNGTLNYAKYQVIFKTVNFMLKFTHGSTSVVGTIPGFSTPVTMSADYAANDPIGGTVELNDATGFRNPAIALVGSSTRIDLYWVNSSITVQSITGTSPFTWTTSDQFMISGTFQMA